MDEVRVSRARGYFLIRDGVPIELGADWPEAAMATADRSKSAVIVEDCDGKVTASVLQKVNDFEAIDQGETLARRAGTHHVDVARYVGVIGKGSPTSIFERAIRFESGRPLKTAKAASVEGFKEVHFEVRKRAAAGDAIRIEGYASTKNIDRDEEVVEPRSVEQTLSASMKSMVLHFNHNVDFVVGKIEALELRDEGMWLTGLISKETNPPQVRTWIEEGIVRAMSIRFMVLEDRFDDTGIRHITKAELLEVSVVTMPSNRESTFSVAKGLTDGTDLSCSRCHESHCGGDDHLPFKRYPLLAHAVAGQPEAILRAGGWGLYRDAHALYKAKDSDQHAHRKASSYQLLHHVIDEGELKTSLQHVQAAMAELLTKEFHCTDQERRAAYDHLAAHLVEFGAEVPPFEIGCGYQQTTSVQPATTAVERETKMPDEIPVPTPATPPPAPAPMPEPTPATPPPAPEPSAPEGYAEIDGAKYARLQQLATMSPDEYAAATQSNPGILNETAELLGSSLIKKFR